MTSTLSTSRTSFGSERETPSRVALADATTINAGIAAAVEAAAPMRLMKPYERQAVLNHCVQRFTERFYELAMSCGFIHQPTHYAAAR